MRYGVAGVRPGLGRPSPPRRSPPGDRDRALELLRDHPLWRSGSEYVIEVFDVQKR
jgi:hypothetical protein